MGDISIIDFVCRMVAFACCVGAIVLDILTIRKFKKLEKGGD